MEDQNLARFFEDLDEEEATRIIMSGLDMIKTFTEVYGAKRGEKLYNEMAELLGEEAKYAIFTAMLTGVVTNSVRIQRKHYNSMNVNKVAAIKATRGVTGLGLKEAKELVEGWYGTGGFDQVKVDFGDRGEYCYALKQAGFEAA